MCHRHRRHGERLQVLSHRGRPSNGDLSAADARMAVPLFESALDYALSIGTTSIGIAWELIGRR